MARAWNGGRRDDQQAGVRLVGLAEHIGPRRIAVEHRQFSGAQRLDRFAVLLEDDVGDTAPRERGVRIDLRLQPELPAADGDAVEIEQVLINLARNALEAMLESPDDVPTLTVETGAAADIVEVIVRDTGPGLPHVDGDIFEPFHTTKPRGLGMGLAICRTTVEAHGGRLVAVSNPTRGATFRFTLPATVGQPGSAGAA